MREGVKRLSEEMGQPHWHEILEALVEAMRPYARHGVNVNVDFYAGVVYYLHGIPEELFVPIFAIGRIPGWTVQAMEQLGNNILIRPRLLYTGPDAREYVPIEERAAEARRGGGGSAAQAIAALIAAAATTSSTVAPRERSHTGRAKPWRKGPIARAPPTCSQSL